MLILSYFPFLFTNFVPNPEVRYDAGWIYISLVAFMLLVNLAAVCHVWIINFTENVRRIVVEQHNYRLLLIRRIEMDIIVMSPLQKFRKYIGVDWLFAE